MIIPRPRFESVPFAAGLKWTGGGGYRFEEKLDGCWSEIVIGDSVIVGERMNDGRFFAFDLPTFQGVDMRRGPLRERLAALDSFGLPRPAAGAGGEFLEAVVSRGGEGIVAKHMEAPFGVRWIKCKALDTFDCRVVEKDGWRASIRLEMNGEDCGWVAARATFDQIQPGDVVEIISRGRHPSGKFREARFIRLRRDKQAPAILSQELC